MNDGPTIQWLKKIMPDLEPPKKITFSKRDELTARQWGEISDWVKQREKEITAAPSILTCAVLGKLDKLDPINHRILEGSMTFKALWNRTHPEKQITN